MGSDNTDLLRVLSPLDLRLQMFYLFYETLGTVVRDSMSLVFRLYGGSAELALSGSDQSVLCRDDSVAPDMGVPEVERSRSADSRFSC